MSTNCLDIWHLIHKIQELQLQTRSHANFLQWISSALHAIGNMQIWQSLRSTSTLLYYKIHYICYHTNVNMTAVKRRQLYSKVLHLPLSTWLAIFYPDVHLCTCSTYVCIDKIGYVCLQLFVNDKRVCWVINVFITNVCAALLMFL